MKRFGWLVLTLCVIVSVIVIYPTFQTPTLKIALIAGSSWNVPEGDSYSRIDRVIEQFEKQHHVQIEYVSGIRLNQYEEYIGQCILKDEIPDVMLIPSDLFATLAENKTLEELDARIIKDNAFSLDKYYETALEEVQINHHTYALPYESVPRVMFVNKTLLEQEGIEMPSSAWTWDDFYEICQKVTKDINHDGKVDQFGYYGYSWEDAIYSNGAKIFDENTHKVVLDNEKIIEASEFMRKLEALHDEKISSTFFDKGQVAFCPMNYSDYRTYMPYPWRVKKYSSFEWDCITMPKGPNGNNTSQIDTLMIGMSSRSKYKDVAWELMKALSYDEDYQKELVKNSQGVSVLKAVMQSKDVIQALKEDNPGNSAFEMTLLDDIMEKGIAIRNTKKYKQLMQALLPQLDVLFENEKDLQNELIRLQRQLNALLEN